jgi:hypothetical protein
LILEGPGNLELFGFIVERVAENGNKNIQDSQGNTVLHVATREVDAKPQVRLEVLVVLLEMQVNPMMKNKAGKYAVQYLPRGEGQAIGLLSQRMAGQEGGCSRI